MASSPARRQPVGVAELRAINEALRRSCSTHANQISTVSGDYPVFSPNYEDEPSPLHFNLRVDRNPKSADHLSSPNNENSDYSASPCLDYKTAMNNAPGEYTVSSPYKALKHSMKNGNQSSFTTHIKSKGKTFSWLFRRTKKKHRSELSFVATVESEDLQPHLKKELGDFSLKVLKKELQETDEKRRIALREVAEMRCSVGELQQKMARLESYCEELKMALKQEIQEEDTLILSTVKRPMLINPTGNIKDDSMPVSYDVMAESFLQMVAEARLSTSNFCEYLARRINETDGSLMEKLNIHPHQHKVTMKKKNSKEVIYNLEALINQHLYQDFENIIFQKNGSSKVLDPHQSRLESFSAFVSFRNMTWNDVLRKATDYYSEYFRMFCDRKMNSILSALNRCKPWPELLLQSFFISARCIWLLHLLACSFNPPVMIFRVDENRSFDPLYMEDVFEGKQLSAETSSAKVMVMVMPGFHMKDRVIRCPVLCK